MRHGEQVQHAAGEASVGCDAAARTASKTVQPRPRSEGAGCLATELEGVVRTSSRIHSAH